MNKKSIYNATYGRLDEMDRHERDMSIAQDRFENPDNDGDDMEPDGFAIADAIDFLTDYFMEDALNMGYNNIDDLAIEQYGIDSNHPSPGSQLIEDSIPLYFSGEIE